ncbi:MAG: hypothetical protein PHD76_03635 [Methylacidiphilales bacterium]|nr:hypothetical protein [Candidatus Methylacidiphilales bacterium]
MFDSIKGIIGDIAAGAIKDQRIALTKEQLTTLDLKLRDAISENARLSHRVIELENLVADRDAKIAQLQPVVNALDPKALEILKFFFDQSCNLSTQDIMRRFQLPMGVADYHTDTLLQRGLIQQTCFGVSSPFGEQPPMSAISGEGRKYIMQNV